MSNQKEEKILEFVKRRGPILPIQVSKEFEMESFLASAILSSLKNNKKIFQSFRKIGSSPLYYTLEQQGKVRSMLYEELNDLEKKALERLKSMKVAFRDDLYPQERVLLSELRDFVSYLKIEIGNEEVLCWKHYSVEDEEFDSILKKKFGEPDEKIEDIEKEVIKPEKIEPETLKDVEISESKDSSFGERNVVSEVGEEEIVSEVGKESGVVSEVKTEIDKKNVQEKPLEVSEDVQKSQEIQTFDTNKEMRAETEFEELVLQFLKENNVKILEREKKRSDINFIVISKTHFGEQKYFVKAKDKKSINKGDVSKCYVESLSKKYPAILLIPKKIRKSVQEYIDSYLKGLITIIVVK